MQPISRCSFACATKSGMCNSPMRYLVVKPTGLLLALLVDKRPDLTAENSATRNKQCAAPAPPRWSRTPSKRWPQQWFKSNISPETGTCNWWGKARQVGHTSLKFSGGSFSYFFHTDQKKALRVSSKCLISLGILWWAMQVSNLRPLQCENANISPFSPLKTTT